MSPKQKGGLGRGLSALIPEATAAATPSGTDEVDIDLVVPNPQQPRAIMEPAALEELAESIRVHGILQPLLVSRAQGERHYQLIAGERRLQAARIAGLARVPVVVREAASHHLLELALVENVQRQDLTPLEEAQAYRRLVDEFQLTQEGVAERVGRSRVAVTNALRLLGLPLDVKNALARGEISEGHARALLGLPSEDDRRAACAIVIEEGLTVRATEELVRNWEGRAKPKPSKRAASSRRDATIAAIEESLRNILGTKVQLMQGRKGGKLVIHYYSEDDLESLVELLSGNVEALADRA